MLATLGLEDLANSIAIRAMESLVVVGGAGLVGG